MSRAVLYFDHNATAPLCAVARQTWLDATEQFIGNPSSLHRIGRRADRVLQEAREELSAILGCDAERIVWTSGATEGNNAVLRHFRDGKGEIWLSALEHPSVAEAARRWFGDRVVGLPVLKNGQIDIESIEAMLKMNRPALIAVMAANNETGVLQPWERLQTLLNDVKVPYFCDAAQWVGKMPARNLGRCSFATGCAHKFGGPGGVGFMKTAHSLSPWQLGGGQEDGQRSGTENLAGILAMVAALRTREAAMTEGITLRQRWRDMFLQQVCLSLPGTLVIGEGAERLWNTATLLLPDVDCRGRWVVKLDKLGVAASTGSACASEKEAPSPILLAMGFGHGETDRVVRFSSGWEATEADWQQLANVLARAGTEFSHGERR